MDQDGSSSSQIRAILVVLNRLGSTRCSRLVNRAGRIANRLDVMSGGRCHHVWGKPRSALAAIGKDDGLRYAMQGITVLFYGNISRGLTRVWGCSESISSLQLHR